MIAAPSAIWQLVHGLPFLDLMRAGAAGKNVVLAPLDFVANQVLVMNPLLAPLWLAGASPPGWTGDSRPGASSASPSSRPSRS